MIGPIIVFVVAVALVATYLYTVNRFLRSDEHWNEPTAVKPQPAREPKLHSALMAPATA